MTSLRGRRWVFTLNNYTNDEESKISDFFTSEHCVYGIKGRETSATGTPHLQGFVIVRLPFRFRRIKSFLGDRCHIELARGTSTQARDYCQKEGDYDEYGVFPAEAGRRSDLDRFFEWSDEFELTHGRPAASPDVAREHPNIYIRYPRATRLTNLRSRRSLFDGLVELRDWQSDLEQELEDPANDREIIFVVDREGGSGKTSFCRHLLSTRTEAVQVLSSGKRDDLAHAILPHKSIFLFNVARGGMEYLSYTLLEQLKDRLVWSGKYNSNMKILHSTPHVVVFSNEEPDMSKLTEDRYRIKYI